MMQLKLLGVLQDFGTPYASLYINDDNKSMYLAIEQDSHKPHIFSSLLLKVTGIMIVNYMQNMIGLRQLSELSKEKYIWDRAKGKKGRMTDLGHVDVRDRIDEGDDMFDAEFCRNENSIRYYIKQNQQVL
jgi:hypothetical protein